MVPKNKIKKRSQAQDEQQQYSESLPRLTATPLEEI